MNKIKFSILIPSIPSRIDKFLLPLYKKLESQVGSRDDVEILCLIDNKKRSIGLKRDSLVQSARGTYLAFIDDDDSVSDDYVKRIVKAIDENPSTDVIVFKQIADFNGASFEVEFGIENENEVAQFDENGKYRNIKRKPFHICAWRSEIAKNERFYDCSYGEDWHWAKRVLNWVTTQTRIDAVLHYYYFRDSVTEAVLTVPPNN